MSVRSIALSATFVAIMSLSLFPQLHSVDIAATGEVVSFYQSILDTTSNNLVRILSDTGTEVVFRGYFKFWTDEVDIFQYLQQTIAEVKARLPWVQFIGGVTASAFYPGDHWPNGTIVSAEDMRQMLWTYPDGTFHRHIYDPDHYVFDIAKPMARQFILAYAYKIIDAGFDALWFDEITYIPEFPGSHIPNGQYAAAWFEMVAAVKEYAMAQYGKTLPVSMNGDSLREEVVDGHTPWPHQDFLTVSVSMDTVMSGQMRDDWAEYKAHVMNTYGRLPPIMYFVDYEEDVALAGLPTSTQIRVLRLLYNTSLRQGVALVYPLHYGRTYDAIREGTYDAIKNLTNTISTVHTITTVSSIPFISTTTTTATATVTQTTTAPLFENPVYVTLLAAVVVLGVAMIALTFRKRSRVPSRS